MTISAVIITRNSAKNLPRVLDSLRNFEEVLVCDIDSTDDSVAIAIDKGARVIRFPYSGPHPELQARNFALKSAKSHWVLYIEPDEIISRKLHDRLYDFIRENKEVNGLYIPHKNYYLNRFNHASYPDYQLRFFKKDRTFWGEHIEAEPEINGKVGKLPAVDKAIAITHLPQTITETIDRLNHITDEEAMAIGHRRIPIWKIIFLTNWEFFKVYVLKGAIFCGTEGYICARNESVRKYFALAKCHDSATTEDFERAEKYDDSES